MRHLLIAVGILLFAVMAIAASDVAVRTDGRVTLAAGTPQAIGVAAGRLDLHFQNTGGTNDMLCGYSEAGLSEVDATGAGFRYVAGAGKISCAFPDIPFFCMSTTGTEVSYDEGHVKTATSTPTTTPTATPTP